MWQIIVGVSLGAGFVAAASFALRRLSANDQAKRRWDRLGTAVGSTNARDGLSSELAAARQSAVDQRGTLGRWLYRAGYRNESATAVFVSASLASFLGGLSVALTVTLSGLQTLFERAVVQVPGGVGETFLPVAWVSPWMAWLMIASVPWLIVRRARQRRVEHIEQDLPLALELLSTLSEAGLGFDAALTRILKTRLAGRPLAAELRMFQADLLAGRTRVEALRRFSSRVDLPSVSVFVSALAQAEQLGMGIARVLRQQADDMRMRRRERAIAFVNALPTKRVIPLVVCFLPGLFVWPLGPAFVQLFKMAETFIQVRSF